MINKVIPSFDEAVADIFDGAVILMGGFGPANGTPSNLLRALAGKSVKNLTLIANTPGYGRDEAGAMPFRKTPPDYDDGGILIQNGQVKKVICAFPGVKRPDGKALLQEKSAAGLLEVELVPQGTLAERIRAAKAGISAFYIPTGAGTVLEYGKETRYFGGRKNILEYPLKADFALIRAYRADRYGNLVYQGTSRNFNSVMAGAAKTTIAEVDELVSLGSLDPESIVTPSIYVNRIVVRPITKKESINESSAG
ncbi:MAG TPA: 3-oxoacid CoA-transferase subunit A [Dehalococcoidales bacterium]|nr:3-oxoacid CoA-transferase subunit A [Dehalococcoidales bacterium]